MQNNWSNMNREERIEALQEFENQNAEADGRGARTVEGKDYEPDAGQYNGEYDHDNNPDKLYINNECLDNEYSSPEDAKNSIAHEGRHATQHDVVDGTIDGEKADIDNEQKEELATDFNSDHSNESLDDYMDRPSERDAREYAAEKTPESDLSKSDMSYYGNSDLDSSLAKENAIAEHSSADFDAFEKGEVNQFSPGQSGVTGESQASQLNGIESTEPATQGTQEATQASQLNEIGSTEQAASQATESASQVSETATKATDLIM